MARASWNGMVLAESERYRVVEDNVYFPPEAVHSDLLVESRHHTVCHWKGTARYYHVVVDGRTNENAAWYYPVTSEAASEIRDYVAFWNGVDVEL
jgi:uncharacterized protein (DUF427 family)